MANKFRAILTTLGIIFGVAAVISMLAIGNGAQQKILEQLEIVGVNNIIIKSVYEKNEDSELEEEEINPLESKKFSPGLTIKDLDNIKKIVPNIKFISPEVGHECFAISSNIRKKTKAVGVNNSYFSIFNLKLENGKIFNSYHNIMRKKVCVLGNKISKKMFPKSNAIGENIRVGNLNLKVIGVLKNLNGVNESLEEMGIKCEAHHHEVATANQNEIATLFNTLTYKADETQTLKYVVQNVAHAYGKTATFMPKPLVGDNGSGMHVHQSISKDGQNVFAGDSYAGLSETALYYIGGVIKHARAINAFTNASTNSYKRLVPGFEAPVMLAYSARNRSASCRIPFGSSPASKRVEVRYPDPLANPYLAFSALLMAGLDGIKNKINPGDPMDKDLYELPAEELKEIPTVAASLREALEALDADREFLKAGGVFDDDQIDAYIAVKMEEVERLDMAPHPVEFDMYYSA